MEGGVPQPCSAVEGCYSCHIDGDRGWSERATELGSEVGDG